MKHVRTILIADDNNHFRMAVRVRLKRLGLKVLEAASGAEVLRDYLARAVDAILLDQEMPDGDGRTIARLIRRESDIPIIFVTGHPPEDFRKVVQSLSEVYYLRKPLNESQLIQLLTSLWHK